MKRILVLFLVFSLLISVAGCVSRTEYDKLANGKEALEKTCEQLLSKEAELKEQIADRRNEIKGIKTELREARKEIRNLENKISALEAPKAK